MVRDFAMVAIGSVATASVLAFAFGNAVDKEFDERPLFGTQECIDAQSLWLTTIHNWKAKDEHDSYSKFMYRESKKVCR